MFGLVLSDGDDYDVIDPAEFLDGDVIDSTTVEDPGAPEEEDID